MEVTRRTDKGISRSGEIINLVDCNGRLPFEDLGHFRLQPVRMHSLEALYFISASIDLPNKALLARPLVSCEKTSEVSRASEV